MKRFIFLFLLFGIGVTAQAVTPQWLRRTPTADNDTYYYKIESAVASTEDVALNKAMGRVILSAVQSLGLGVNSNDVEKAIADGSVARSFATDYRIPIRHVCTYRKRADKNNIRVFVLCQVAKAGNISVQFSEFTNCGSQGDISSGGGSNNFPSEWDKYMNDSQYEWVLKLDDVQKGEDLRSIELELRKDAKTDIANRLGVPDTSSLLGQLICYEAYSYNKKEKTLSILAHIEKNRLLNLYEQIVKDNIHTTQMLINCAQSRANAEDYSRAVADCKLAKDNIVTSRQHLNIMRNYHADEFVLNNYSAMIDKQGKQIETDISTFHRQDVSNREQKLMNLLETADKAEHYDLKLGSALQYYYGALAFMEDMVNVENLQFTSQYDQQPSHYISTWLEGHIRQILREVQIVAVKSSRRNSEADLRFSWGGNQKSPCMDVSYRYNYGAGMGDYIRIPDNLGFAEFPSSLDVDKLEVQLEYRFDGEWGDPELGRLVKNCKRNFNTEASHQIVIAPAEKQTMPVTNSMATISQTQDKSLSQNLDKVIANVCQAINQGDQNTIDAYCTDNGKEVFHAFMRTGKVRVHNAPMYDLVTFCGDTYVRSIPMTISYRQGKSVMENVVLVFNNEMKIDGLQYALDQLTLQDIMGHPSKGMDRVMWNDTIKYSIVNFLENYRTAYSLKRIDFISTLFADDAVIIVGRVVKPQKEMKDSRTVNMKPQITYSHPTKKEYIERLKQNFQSNEWININFANADVSVGRGMHGIQLKQNYSSTHYGDEGFLFLMVDFSRQDEPLIHLRAWTPDGKYSFEDYDKLLQEERRR